MAEAVANLLQNSQLIRSQHLPSDEQFAPTTCSFAMKKDSQDSIKIPRDKPILLFDGVCNLCNGLVQFIIERDPNAQFRFTALQSETGQFLLKEAGLSTSALNTVVMYDDGKFYTHSDVPLQIACHLGKLWRFFYIFKYLPKGIRDRIYDWIAANRYKWFGKQDACMMPTPDLKRRFL